MLFKSVIKTLGGLAALLEQLDEKQYVKPWHELGNATIGKHVRHIIELFQCLTNQYESGIVDYNARPRDMKIETNIRFALNCIEDLQDKIVKPNKTLLLITLVNPIESISIESNYFRELAYNIEHCIHHEALIKVALMSLADMQFADNFGIAPSTIQYQSENIQS